MIKVFYLHLNFYMNDSIDIEILGGRRGHDCLVVRFTISYM